MFTGIIQAIGNVRATESKGGDSRLRFAVGDLRFDQLSLGDSIAVNGACLTVTALNDGEFAADVSQETLGLTTLGELAVGDRVNLEPSLTLTTLLGGHLVSGHIDAIGKVASIGRDARSTRVSIDLPESLVRYVARKGSIAVDGTSLTVNDISGARLEVNIVPHTLEATIMGAYEIGTRVNLEVDLIARYLERLIDLPAQGATD
jgi:riboflavin synthase